MTDLQRPGGRRVEGEPERVRIELRRFDVVPILIRLAPPERRGFDLDPIGDEPRGDDAEGDVVRDRRFGIVHSGKPMHERRRAERGLAGQAEVDVDVIAIAQRERVSRGELHEQIVRMLAVDERRFAVGGFASLKQQRVAALADGRGLGGEHGAQSQRSQAQ